MKFAYADPPYPGQAKKLYKCEEVNHEILINSLDLHYDGWALSTSSSALKDVLELCPPHVRIAAWVKPFCAFKPNVNPAYAWEPVIYHTPKKRTREEDTVRDWHSDNITLQKGLPGAKPKGFCLWILNLLGVSKEDEFFDLFPGTGMVTKTWKEWRETSNILEVAE